MARKTKTEDGNEDHGQMDAMLPLIPHYRRDQLRPNYCSARPERGPLAYAQGTSMVGEFGDQEDPEGLMCPDTSAGGSRVRPAIGLPPAQAPTPEGKPNDTSRGWL